LLSFVKKSFQSDSVLHGIDAGSNCWKNQCFKCLERGSRQFGVGDPKAGEYAIKSFVAATKALKDDLIDVLVTAPINKYNIQSEDLNSLVIQIIWIKN
jgi:4-hydroxythreonine-4-phosphate dehydrogenase